MSSQRSLLVLTFNRVLAQNHFLDSRCRFRTVTYYQLKNVHATTQRVGNPNPCVIVYRIFRPLRVATDIGKVWAHLGPWIKEFGIEFEVSAVVSDAEFAALWPGVEAAATVE